MDALVRTVVGELLPGSAPFLIVCLAVGTTLLYWKGRGERWGRRWLTALAGMYWLMSVPLGAKGLVALLSYGYHPIAAVGEASGATAIVVLDAGTMSVRLGGKEIAVVSRASAFRALEAARVYRLLDHPWVIVSAGSYEPQPAWRLEGSVLRGELTKAGVPADRIVLDTRSRNTREHAINIAPLLRERGIDRFVLVTSVTHIRRAQLAFEAQGLQPVPSVSGFRSEGEGRRHWPSWWPSAVDLQESEDAMHDFLGLLYYWIRGWLSPP